MTTPRAAKIRIPTRRKVLVVVTALLIMAVVGVAALLALDIYLHHRVQYDAGVNVWGYRGPVIGKKRPGEVRAVVLGGSTAFGYGLPWDQAFPYYLERDLNARASGGLRYSVVNLGAPGQGAYGFQFDLADYAYLQYDAAILYEGYNDLGSRDLPDAVPARTGPNDLLWRRQSPVFGLTGYFPILPLVFHEKAMALRAGGDLDAAYRGRTRFTPGLATRATASALDAAAAVAERVGTQLGQLSTRDRLDPVSTEEVETWRHYVSCVLAATDHARRHDVKVIVVSQPYGSDTHIRQQRALAMALAERFGADASVRYVNLGPLLNVRDHSVAYDGLHLVAAANAVVADHLVQPVLDVLGRAHPPRS
jgi:hypothetical protein